MMSKYWALLLLVILFYSRHSVFATDAEILDDSEWKIDELRKQIDNISNSINKVDINNLIEEVFEPNAENQAVSQDHKVFENNKISQNDKISQKNVTKEEQFKCSGVCKSASSPNEILIYKNINYDSTFNTIWEDYKNGFGNINSNYFIGLETIHQLTKKPCQLYITLEYWNNTHLYTNYDNFKIDDNYNNQHRYKIVSLGHCTGTAGDLMRSSENTFFKTRDNSYGYNWARSLGYGWWFPKKNPPR